MALCNRWYDLNGETDMTLHDVYLLSPELSIAALGIVVIILDMVIGRKGVLAVVSVAGLVVPLAFSISLWGDLSGEPDGQMVGIFNTLVVDKFSLFFKFLVMEIRSVVAARSIIPLAEKSISP